MRENRNRSSTRNELTRKKANNNNNKRKTNTKNIKMNKNKKKPLKKMSPSQRKREIMRRKKRLRFKRIRAVIILIILLLIIVYSFKAIKKKVQNNSSNNEVETTYDGKEKELEEIEREKRKENGTKNGERLKLKPEEERKRIEKFENLENENDQKQDDGQLATGEALNVIERDGNTNIYEEVSLNSKIVTTLKDHDKVDIIEVLPSGWLKVNTPSGETGYVEAVRIRSDKLPPHDYNKDSAENVLIINQDSQTLRLYNKGKEILKSKISTGIDSEFTPKGVFTINKNHSGEWDFAKNFNEGYKYFTSFYPHGYLLHSLPMNENQEVLPEEARKLGSKASHGCIRLPIPVAKYIFEKVPDKSMLIIE